MKSVNRILTFLVLIGLVVGGFFVSRQISQDTSTEDTDALFGGQLERNYLSGGYLINYKQDGSIETCGYTALSNAYGVTAAHCVENSREIYVGISEFSYEKSIQLRVARAVAKEGWLLRQERAEDFALLNFAPAPGQFFTDLASIESPTEGCGYKVVAYGRTENDTGSSRERLRKSASVCISRIDSRTFYINAKDAAGICFGDSGSPIYKEGTNVLVGIVVSIVKGTSSNPNSPCDFNNTAIVVRVDANQSVISQNADLPTNLSASDGTLVSIVSQSAFDRILTRVNTVHMFAITFMMIVVWYVLNYSNHVIKDKDSDL